MKMMLKKQRFAGFTLVELMVVVIIVGILAAVAVPVYRYNVRRSMASEGMALVGSVRTAEKVWFAEHNTYTGTWTDLAGQIDFANNKYFTTQPVLTGASATAFTCTATATAGTDAAGIAVAIDQNGVITTTGL